VKSWLSLRHTPYISIYLPMNKTSYPIGRNFVHHYLPGSKTQPRTWSSSCQMHGCFFCVKWLLHSFSALCTHIFSIISILFIELNSQEETEQVYLHCVFVCVYTNFFFYTNWMPRGNRKLGWGLHISFCSLVVKYEKKCWLEFKGTNGR
jgi:hypothetical protein